MKPFSSSYYTYIAVNIKNFRKYEIQKNQYELADILGITQTEVSRAERNLSPTAVALVANYMLHTFPESRERIFKNTPDSFEQNFELVHVFTNKSKLAADLTFQTERQKTSMTFQTAAHTYISMVEIIENEAKPLLLENVIPVDHPSYQILKKLVKLLP
jgi:DNA-binding XRE family transcriptional regulator